MTIKDFCPCCGWSMEVNGEKCPMCLALFCPECKGVYNVPPKLVKEVDGPVCECKSAAANERRSHFKDSGTVSTRLR